jgi:xanthine dehydrogenase accessory factor
MTSDLDFFREITRLLETGKKVALCTIIEKQGSAPREVGTKILVGEEGLIAGTIGGGYFERFLIDESRKSLKEGQSKSISFYLDKGKKEGSVETGLICGGQLNIFIDVIKPKPALIIIGAGHVALALAKFASISGFALTLIDDNEEAANKTRYPMADRIITGEFAEILQDLDIDRSDYVLILHGEPEHDYVALEKMIKKRPIYIGLLASKAKAATLITRLRDAGASEQDLRPLHAPVGLEIGAQTPEEIAISILAEIIATQHEKQ